MNLSYALNYAGGGTAVFGYHLVNLLIHLLAALTLFGIIRRTLSLNLFFKNELGNKSPDRPAHALPPTLLALAVSAIWAWHPVQTESVTYLSQRAESLMGLFYLLTLYCFIRGVDRVVPNALGDVADETSALGIRLRRASADCATRSTPVGGDPLWFTLSVLACLAGVGTKEVIVTAPLMVFLYDRTFISGTFSGAWQRHGRLYWALAATWIPLGILLGGLHHRGVGFGQGATWWAYGLTECRVLVRYLRLAFWPDPLVFDYGNSVVAAHLSEVWPFALVLIALLIATGWTLFRRSADGGSVRLRPWGFGGQALGFAGAWFFLILAPTSSVVPVVNQPMAENRLYLPLAGVAALVVVGTVSLAGRWSLPVFAVIAAVLGLASVQRNRDYASGPAIWSDTIAKVPDNARAHGNLGYELAKIPGRLSDAIAEDEVALRLQPDYAEAHSALANAWEQLPGRLNDAIAEDEAFVRLRPDLAQAHYNLGTVLGRIPGRLSDAIAQEEAAVRLQPGFVEAHYNLGTMLARTPDRQDEAVAQYEAAIRLEPDHVEAHEMLGNALSAAGRLPDAVTQYEEAVRLRPDYEAGHYNLANTLKKMPGRQNEAIAQYEAAIRLQPTHVEAHNNLGNALNAVGRTDEAIEQYMETLRLNPNFAPAHLNLAVALLKSADRTPEAAAQLEAVLRLQPENEAARQLLDRIKASSP